MLRIRGIYQTRESRLGAGNEERMHQARKGSLRPRRWPQVLQSKGRHLKQSKMVMKTLTSLSPGPCGIAAGAVSLALTDEGAVRRAAYSSTRTVALDFALRQI